MPLAEDVPTRIEITFKHRDSNSSDSDLTSAFWSQVQSNHRNSGLDDSSAKRLEERIIANFGRDLRDTLIQEFKFGGGARNHRRKEFPEHMVEYRASPGPVPSFCFQVTGLKYGSLALGIDVIGVKGLVEFFDNNFDLFKTVLNQYAPLAFAVSATAYSSAYIDGLTSTVEASKQLSDAFNKDQTPTKPVDKATEGLLAGKAQAVNWAWVVSNTSLILPVVLALAIIYIAFQSLSSERDELRKAVLQLQDRQNEVIRLLAPTLPKPAETAPTAPPVQTPVPPKKQE